MTAKQRRTVTEEIENGRVKIIVGTHALISEQTNLETLRSSSRTSSTGSGFPKENSWKTKAGTPTS